MLAIFFASSIEFSSFKLHQANSERYCSSCEKEKNEIIKSLKENPKIIGVGETGLDYYYNNSDKEKQITSFKTHIEAAIECDVPIIVHSRNAEDDTFEILNEYREHNTKILMHCFTGSKKFSEKLLTLNSYFSASGIITFKNSIDLQETFRSLPIDKVLIETDSPYLAPVPNRGKKMNPLLLILQQINSQR